MFSFSKFRFVVRFENVFFVQTSKFLLPKKYYDLYNDDDDVLIDTQQQDADDICLIKDENIQDSIKVYSAINSTLLDYFIFVCRMRFFK